MTEEEAEAAFERHLEILEEELERKHERIAAEREDRQRALEEEHAVVLSILDTAAPDAIAAAYEALRIVADLDGDYASEENAVGFSKAHTGIGHRLARLPDERRDRISDAYALKIARIYRRQIGADLQSRIA